MEIYLVEAQFQSYDSYYEQIVGVFDNEELAEFHKEKFNFFKTKHQEIFEPFLELRDEDGYWISDEVENDYYKKQKEYSLIYEFSDIVIRQLKLNEDWMNMNYFRTENQYDMMKQFSIEYNREHNLNKLLT
jgi:hypothetical protein